MKIKKTPLVLRQHEDN